MSERFVQANGVELCTEPFGDPADPPILLIMGIGASMLRWEEEFCRLLADAGRFVIRYDHRDTGRSVTYEPGRPGYTGADLAADAHDQEDRRVGRVAEGLRAELHAVRVDHPLGHVFPLSGSGTATAWMPRIIADSR